jgi:hypothetical protein
MRIPLKISLSLVLLIIVISTNALATPIYFSADRTMLENVLAKMDVEYTVTLDDYGAPSWTVTWFDLVITIAAYDEQSSGGYASLLFYAGWETESAPSLSTINQWNMQSRFGRAYLDESGDPAIELDLLLVGGVTAQTIEEYILVFVAAVSDLGITLQL